MCFPLGSVWISFAFEVGIVFLIRMAIPQPLLPDSCVAQKVCEAFFQSRAKAFSSVLFCALVSASTRMSVWGCKSLKICFRSVEFEMPLTFRKVCLNCAMDGLFSGFASRLVPARRK